MERWLAVVLGLVLVVAGFAYAYGNPPPARASDSQGWRETSSSDDYVLVSVHRRSYDSPGKTLGGALVATAGDWPGLPESALVPRVLDRVAEKENMKLTERGQETLSFTELGNLAVKGTVYDVQKQGTPGTARAIVTDFPCPAGAGYVVAVGYGTLGSNLVPATYDKAKRIVKSVVCG